MSPALMNECEEMGQGTLTSQTSWSSRKARAAHRQELLLDVQLCLMHSLPPSSTLIPPLPVENMDCPMGHCRVLEEGKPCSAATKPPMIHSTGCTALAGYFAVTEST